MPQSSTRRDTASPTQESRRQMSAPDRSTPRGDDTNAPPMRDDTTADSKSTDRKEPAADADQPPIQEFPKMIRRSDDSLQIVQNQAEEDQVRQSDQEAQAAHK